ncbi:hypothetical protein TorRG33x02_191410 [Trema orientale]|uniref:Uncharacterized protein n=1 Tax=Trema orientale TaxID=63057 RepID=A0A2P5EHL9_TREOI|nr:hypothetical protein TorRG33x02_191410 [Trema orientale]
MFEKLDLIVSDKSENSPLDRPLQGQKGDQKIANKSFVTKSDPSKSKRDKVTNDGNDNTMIMMTHISTFE